MQARLSLDVEKVDVVEIVEETKVVEGAKVAMWWTDEP